MAQAIQLSPFAQRYMEELKSLVNTDRKTISFLRNLAEENQQAEKLHIVVALQQYLYYHCPAPQQLPLLYLVDCILKTVTQHYLPLLCPPLPSMFMFVWRSSPQLHAQLAKLANTWRTYLPAQTQAQIDQVIASTPSTSAPAHVAPAARATPPHAGSTTQGWQVQAAAPSAGMQQPMLDAAQAMQAPAAAQLLLLAQSGGGMQLLQQGGYAAAAQAHGSVAPAYTAAPYAAPQQQQQQALQYAQAAPMQAPAVASASGPPVSSEDIMASLQKLFWRQQQRQG